MQQAQRSKPVISSLFSSNPKFTPPANPRLSNIAAHPTNAPLLNASSFEQLGLNPILAAHLHLKMNIRKPTAIQREALSALISSEGEATTKDVFIQSQTGSGKTLSFLLPILHDLLPLSELSHVNRALGTLAIIISPTRELARQTSQVLESLLTLRLRSRNEESQTEEPPRLTRWLVAGLLTGGATRSHEKARIRKGLPIVVATPGRLLDHIQNTASFDTSKCRWLVLDEADTLMDLGFEETIRGILKGLDGRRSLAIHASQQIANQTTAWDWNAPRRTVLCSATVRNDVKSLAGVVLRDPVMVQIEQSEDSDAVLTSEPRLGMPKQLSHKYVMVPLKLRLVTLIALIRALLAESCAKDQHPRIVVFCNCTDEVDFLYALFGHATLSRDDDLCLSTGGHLEPLDSSDAADRVCELFPGAYIYQLHGSMEDTRRQVSTRRFLANEEGSTILFCTSVASRGLDMPSLSAVIQYDLPTEHGVEEYVHRVGRTARMGQGGEAWSFVLPQEKEWVSWLEGKLLHGSSGHTPASSQLLLSVKFEDVLRNGFGGEHQRRATQVQLALERIVLTNSKVRMFVNFFVFQLTSSRCSILPGAPSSPIFVPTQRTPTRRNLYFTCEICILGT